MASKTYVIGEHTYALREQVEYYNDQNNLEGYELELLDEDGDVSDWIHSWGPDGDALHGYPMDHDAEWCDMGNYPPSELAIKKVLSRSYDYTQHPAVNPLTGVTQHPVRYTMTDQDTFEYAVWGREYTTDRIRRLELEVGDLQAMRQEHLAVLSQSQGPSVLTSTPPIDGVKDPAGPVHPVLEVPNAVWGKLLDTMDAEAALGPCSVGPVCPGGGACGLSANVCGCTGVTGP